MLLVRPRNPLLIRPPLAAHASPIGNECHCPPGQTVAFSHRTRIAPASPSLSRSLDVGVLFCGGNQQRERKYCSLVDLLWAERISIAVPDHVRVRPRPCRPPAPSSGRWSPLSSLPHKTKLRFRNLFPLTFVEKNRARGAVLSTCRKGLEVQNFK